jgi:hypothetical protein
VVRLFGCVEVYSARFLFHYEPVFNAETYWHFLEQVAHVYYPRPVHYIHDRASYHRDAQVAAWFREQRRWWHTHILPKCSPEDNAAEPIWKHVRLHGTTSVRLEVEQIQLVGKWSGVFWGVSLAEGPQNGRFLEKSNAENL